MSTYTQILYQLVFSTYKREKTMMESGQEPLYKYISGILKNKNCHLYRVNGVEDHIHIVTHVHPSIVVATLIKDIKLACTSWNKETGNFKNFHGWQEGYGAFTYAIKDKDRLINYVKNQKIHHKGISSREEFLQLLIEHGVEFDERYLL